MQLPTSVLALAGMAAALPGADGGYGGGGGRCRTSSSCNAVYHTVTSTVPYVNTKTVTVTTYKPVQLATYYDTYVPVTTYKEQVYNVTTTVPRTITITKPVVDSVVVCKTSYTTNYQTTCLTTPTESICPATTRLLSTYSTKQKVPTTVTTQTPCPLTTTSLCTQTSTSVCTQTSSECKPWTTCKKPRTGYPTPKPKYAGGGGPGRDH